MIPQKEVCNTYYRRSANAIACLGPSQSVLGSSKNRFGPDRKRLYNFSLGHNTAQSARAWQESRVYRHQLSED